MIKEQAIYDNVGWISLENKIIEKKSETWARHAWNMAKKKRLPWANKVITPGDE